MKNLSNFRKTVETSLDPHLQSRPFPSSPGPLYQNEVKCSAFDMQTILHCHANKTHFHKKGCALSLVLKVRDSGTRKWPIVHQTAFFFSTQYCER